MNTYTSNTMKILQLLLRCGMICREELSVVLELMPEHSDRRARAVQDAGDVALERV